MYFRFFLNLPYLLSRLCKTDCSYIKHHFQAATIIANGTQQQARVQPNNSVTIYIKKGRSKLVLNVEEKTEKQCTFYCF